MKNFTIAVLSLSVIFSACTDLDQTEDTRRCGRITDSVHLGLTETDFDTYVVTYSKSKSSLLFLDPETCSVKLLLPFASNDSQKPFTSFPVTSFYRNHFVITAKAETIANKSIKKNGENLNLSIPAIEGTTIIASLEHDQETPIPHIELLIDSFEETDFEHRNIVDHNFSRGMDVIHSSMAGGILSIIKEDLFIKNSGEKDIKRFNIAGINLDRDILSTQEEGLYHYHVSADDLFPSTVEGQKRIVDFKPNYSLESYLDYTSKNVVVFSDHMNEVVSFNLQDSTQIQSYDLGKGIKFISKDRKRVELYAEDRYVDLDQKVIIEE